MAISADDYTEILSAVVSEHSSKLVDQLVTSHPVLDLIADVKSELSGHSLVLPLEVATNETTADTDAHGTFSTAYEGDLVAAAKYDVGTPIVTTSTLSWQVLQTIAGKNQVLDLARVHTNAAVKAQRRAIAAKLWAPARSSSFESIPSIVSATGAVGGIDPATAGREFWAASEYEIDTADIADLRKALRLVTNRAEKRANDQIDTLFMGLTAFEEFEDSVLASGARYDVGSTMDKANTRFREYFHGDLLVRYDPDMPADEIFGLRARQGDGALTFRVVNGNFMKLQEAQFVVGSVAGKQSMDKIQPWATLALLGTNERRAHFRIKRTYTGTKANPDFEV